MLWWEKGNARGATMKDVISDISRTIGRLKGELDNLQEIAKYTKPLPGEQPVLQGIDIYGDSMPLNGTAGGDHIVYLDFRKRYDLDARIRQARKERRGAVVEKLVSCKSMAGIAVVDVSGHQITDAMLAGMLHQAFLLGAIYELDTNGCITKRLFENLNTRFYNSSSVSKFLTMIYGEISEDGTFQFISAGHPAPIVFSYLNDRIMEVSQELCTSFPPIGTLPSEVDIDRRASKSVLGYKREYEVNEWTLMGAGDILLLYTDGLLEHVRGNEEYFPGRLEGLLREVKDRDARGIWDAIRDDVLAFEKPEDDVSFVVIKRD
jgi:serine phosphatase RsbU (regulator of sigma subunit)